MLFGCPLGDQACPVLREMVVQGAPGMDDPGEFSRVNQACLDLGGVGFLLAGQFLGCSLVGTSLLFVLHSVRVGVSEVPNAAALP